MFKSNVNFYLVILFITICSCSKIKNDKSIQIFKCEKIIAEDGIIKEEYSINGEKIGWCFSSDERKSFFTFYIRNEECLKANYGETDNNYFYLKYYKKLKDNKWVSFGTVLFTYEDDMKFDTICNNGYLIPRMLSGNYKMVVNKKNEFLIYLFSVKWIDMYKINMIYTQDLVNYYLLIDTTIYKKSKNEISKLRINIIPQKRGFFLIKGKIIPLDTSEYGEKLINRFEWPFYMNYIVE